MFGNRKLKEEIESLRILSDRKGTQIGVLQGELDTCRELNDALRTSNDEHHREIGRLNNQVKDLTGQLDTWKEVAETRDSDREREMKRAEALEESLTEATRLLGVERDAANGLRSEVTYCQQIGNDWKKTADDLRTERDAYKKSHEELSAEVSTAKRVAEGYRKEWEAAKEQLVVMEANRATLKEENNHLIEDLGKERSLVNDRTSVLNDTMDANILLKEQLKQANEKIAEMENRRRRNRGTNGRFQPSNSPKK